MALLDSAVWCCGVLWLLSAALYWVPQLRLKLLKPQSLKIKYGAKWALVSGGSSGIGRSFVEKLAAQGLNVVVAAFPDKVLEESVEAYKKSFPEVEIRKVGVDLSKAGFMASLVEATKDVDVQVVINNAGYIKTGFFTSTPFGVQRANHDVNATAAVEITHHFVSALQAKQLRGCVSFTSSPAGFMPCPFSVMYGATKAYLTMFAQSLAPELYPDGIDVCVVHPSPVESRFYAGAHNLDAINFFRSTATGPDTIADIVLSSVGHAVTIDQGYYPPSVRFLLKVIDINFMADLVTAVIGYMPDFKTVRAAEQAKKGKTL